MVAIILLIGLVGALGALRVACWYFKRRGEHAVLAGKAMEKFFHAADGLINDERTPDLIVTYLHSMGRTIRRTSVSRVTLWNWLSGRTLKLHENPPADYLEFRAALKGLPEEQMKLMATAMVSFAFAVSYSASVSGWLLRRLWLWPVSTPKDQQALRKTGEGLNQAEPFLTSLRPLQSCAV